MSLSSRTSPIQVKAVKAKVIEALTVPDSGYTKLIVHCLMAFDLSIMRFNVWLPKRVSVERGDYVEVSFLPGSIYNRYLALENLGKNVTICKNCGQLDLIEKPDQLLPDQDGPDRNSCNYCIAESSECVDTDRDTDTAVASVYIDELFQILYITNKVI